MFDWAIIIARLFQFASALVLFGSSLFYLYGFKAETSGVLNRNWIWARRTLLIASIAALLATIFWIMAETALLSGEAKDAVDLTSLWSVLVGTRLGRICVLRLGLLMVSILGFWLLSSLRKLSVMQSIIGGILIASFAWTGHGAKNEGFAGVVHLGGDVFHLISAGVWIGALVPLSILVVYSYRTQTDSDVRITFNGLNRFSELGIVVVSALVVSGVINSWFLIGPAHWRELFSSPYGIWLTIKIFLFGILLVLAAANRFWLLPRLNSAFLESASMKSALQALRVSLLAETALAFLVLTVVAILGTLEPPISAD